MATIASLKSMPSSPSSPKSRPLSWQLRASVCSSPRLGTRSRSFAIKCSASSSGEVASVDDSSRDAEQGEGSWIPVVPVSALPRGERRLIRQDDQTVLLLWYKDNVFAIENKSPAEGAYSEGLFNARLTPDGCIVCPSTSSTFDLKTGEIKEWYPTNPVMKLLIKPTRQLVVYPVKTDSGSIYINMQQQASTKSAELVFGGQANAGSRTASDVNIEEVRMVVDEEGKSTGFGFTPDNEITNGRAAMMGFSVLLIFELVTGKGLLKGTGFLDFLYQYLKN